LKKSAIRRSARSIPRSISAADKLLNVAVCSDRSVSKRSRSAPRRSLEPRRTSLRSADAARTRPGPLGPERVKDQHAEHRPADAQRKRQRRPDAQGPEALPIGRRVLGQLVDPREPDDFSPLNPVSRPGELTDLENRGHSVDAFDRPGNANGPAGNVLDEAGPIHPQELHDALQPAFDLRVHVAQRDGNQARGELDTSPKRNRSASGSPRAPGASARTRDRR
jgi:hypothetical protein